MPPRPHGKKGLYEANRKGIHCHCAPIGNVCKIIHLLDTPSFFEHEKSTPKMGCK